MEAEQYIQMTTFKQTKLDHELMSESESEMHCRVSYISIDLTECVSRQIHELFAGSDPTKANVFPGVRKMETEVNMYTQDIYNWLFR